MKTHLFNIILLLACFALPVAAQTDTKTVPSAPAMPYKLTLNTIGNNNGTVKIEDNTTGGNGIVVVGNDTLAYGAPLSGTPGTANPNATTVKFTITPKANYSRRKNYPKVYKTGDAEKTQLSLTVVSSDNPSVYTFSMPDSPVTIEVAYATKLKSADDITLKKDYSSSTDVIAELPASAVFTLESGHKVSLPVSRWEYNTADNNGSGVHNNGESGGSYNTNTAAVNVFTCTLDQAALPQAPNDSLDYAILTNNTCKVKVANMAKPLVPGTGDSDKTLVILPGTGDNLNAQLGNASQSKPFNGTIGDGQATTTVESIEIDGSVKDATLTLKNIKVEKSGEQPKTEIKAGADITLIVEGNSDLGKLTVGNGSSVILHPKEGASIGSTQIDNSGTFIDSTATVTSVTGTGALDIDANLKGGKQVPVNTPVTLTATTNDAGAKGSTTTFLWQKKNSDGSYTDMDSHTQSPSAVTTFSAPATRAGSAGLTDTYLPPTNTAGSTAYRCLIKREKDNTLTLLSTKSATVTVTPKSNPDTDPSNPSETVYYNVTLPRLTGATTNPDAGKQKVEAWTDFVFTLTLDKDYDQSQPIVTTSRGETLTARISDNAYIVKDVHSDIEIYIAGIVKNTPDVANETVSSDAIKVWTIGSQLHIHTATPTDIYIYTFSGGLSKQLGLLSGDKTIALPQGNYIVVAGNKVFKVQINL